MKPETFPKAPIDDLVERVADQGLPFRRWPGELRAAWRAEQRTKRRRELAFIHSIGLLLCLLCLPLDYIGGSQVFEAGLWLRVGIVTPVYLAAIFAARYGGWVLQRWTSVLTVPCFATVACTIGLHFAADQMREYVMAAGLLITMSAVVVPLRPVFIATMTGLSLTGMWSAWATMPPIGDGTEHVLLSFITVISVITLAIPVRTARLKDQNFLFALRSRFVSDRLLVANEQLRELSHRDDLTGLPNRRCFERIFDTAFRASVDSGDHLAVMMIDVDRFKSFNDTHGHLAGDRALQQVASVLEQQFDAAGHTVARYGGEEFVVVVQGCDEGAALRLADQARRAIAERPVAVDRTQRVAITISIGVALREDTGLSPSALIGRADGALYDAKAAGRDIVRLARDDDGREPPTILKKSA